ncbi:MAG: NAD(P)-dependent oxidoreductase [Thermaceae bacterium]|nr:NAD(P)-dependent oxidoreductase [Thermaceae bacterium]
MARVLLLGASGFLGRHIHQALRQEAQVASVVCLGRKNRPASDPWVQHDLSQGSLEALVSIIQQAQPDVVINAVGSLVGSVLELVEANVLVVAKIIEAVARAAPQARLVKLGSAGEYGVVETGIAVNEDSPTHPVSVYGITRLASAQLVALAKLEGRLDGVVLRVFNPIGAGLPAENMLGRAASQMRQARKQGRDYIEMGPLGAYRDFVDVRDVARAVVKAALAAPLEAPILNVGSGQAVCNRELVQLLAATAGFQGQILEANPAPARSASVNWIQADISRIRQTLGWEPIYSLKDSVEYLWQAES